MADKTETQQAANAPAARVPITSLLAATLLAVILGGGVILGAAWFLIRSGKLPVVQGSVTKAASSTAAEVPTRLLTMEPMLVNLGDPDGRSYLRLAVTLRVEDTPPAKGEKPKEEKAEKGKAAEDQSALRDAALDVLGRETSADLLAERGKEQLKASLRKAFAEHVPETRVKDVLFTEFLVQR